MPEAVNPLHLDGIVLRTGRPDDDAELVRLAALDSARPLKGPTLVADENGAIVAALCLSTGRVIADPFVPSVHLVELLRRVGASRRPQAAPRRRGLLPRPAFRNG